MDIAETLRQDIHKGDFFDFPLAGEEQIKKLKELGLHLEAEGEVLNGASSGGSPEENKETNNNHLMMNTVDMVNYVDSSFWTSDNNAMLEDLGCWSSSGGVQASKGPDNTDGAIYTLTVLNGTEGSTAWFKHEDKEERQTTLDIDSLLNIIPSNFTQPSYQPEPKQPFTYEDSGFADTSKEGEPALMDAQDMGLATSTAFTATNGGAAPAANPEPSASEVDSLLRNALQGKGFARYNGVKIEKEEKDEKILSLETALVYDSSGGVGDSDNPSSAHSMDDIFLSQLDVSYPEDYEKLKRIETEVAESVEQFCLDRGTFSAPPTTLSHIAVDPNILQNKNKKYSKRSKSSSSSAGSSGVRKERSLHYCNICNKGFKDKYSVNVHIRTHTGEKPFTCSLCGKSFRQKAHLAKHYQTHVAQAKNGGVSTTQKSNKNLISTS